MQSWARQRRAGTTARRHWAMRAVTQQNLPAGCTHLAGSGSSFHTGEASEMASRLIAASHRCSNRTCHASGNRSVAAPGAHTASAATLAAHKLARRARQMCRCAATHLLLRKLHATCCGRARADAHTEAAALTGLARHHRRTPLVLHGQPQRQQHLGDAPPCTLLLTPPPLSLGAAGGAGGLPRGAAKGLHDQPPHALWPLGHRQREAAGRGGHGGPKARDEGGGGGGGLMQRLARCARVAGLQQGAAGPVGWGRGYGAGGRGRGRGMHAAAVWWRLRALRLKAPLLPAAPAHAPAGRPSASQHPCCGSGRTCGTTRGPRPRPACVSTPRPARVWTCVCTCVRACARACTPITTVRVQ